MNKNVFKTIKSTGFFEKRSSLGLQSENVSAILSTSSQSDKTRGLLIVHTNWLGEFKAE